MDRVSAGALIEVRRRLPGVSLVQAVHHVVGPGAVDEADSVAPQPPGTRAPYRQAPVQASSAPRSHSSRRASRSGRNTAICSPIAS